MDYFKKGFVFLVISGFAFLLVHVVIKVYSLSAGFDKDLLFALSGGAVGGVFYMTRGFYQSVIQDVFDFKKYVWWYLLRPPMAAIAGSVSYLLIYSAFDLEPTFKNTCAFFLIALFAGYNFTTFVDGRIKKADVYG